MSLYLAGGPGTMSEFKAKIKEFIMTEVNPDRNLVELGDDEPLVDSEIIDSLGILKIMAFLDEEFGIDLSAEQIKLENFRNVTSICSLIEKNKK
jgi:acyl carrier protein